MAIIPQVVQKKQCHRPWVCAPNTYGVPVGVVSLTNIISVIMRVEKA